MPQVAGESVEAVSGHLQYPEAVAMEEEEEEGGIEVVMGVMEDIEVVALVFPSFFPSSDLAEEVFLVF